MTDLATELERLAAADDLPLRGFLPLGSFGVNVTAGRPDYTATLDLLFRQRVTDRPRRPDDAIAARLQLRPCAADDPLFTLGGPVELPEHMRAAALQRAMTFDGRGTQKA